MIMNRVVTYNDGPWYNPLEILKDMGSNNVMIEQMVLKISEYEKRRLFALKELKDEPLKDNEFLKILKDSCQTMAKSLVEQFHSFKEYTNKKIKSITVINSQGLPKPSFSKMFEQLLGVNGIPIYHITGMNCGSGFLAMQHLHSLRQNDPLKKNECDLLFSIEVPSTTIRKKRKMLPLHYFFYDVVISDGAGLAVIESEKHASGLEITGHQNYFFPAVQDTLISNANGNQIEHGISPELFEDIENTVNPAVHDFLKNVNLKFDQIKHFIIHPGGVRLIKCACKALGLEDETVKHALDTVRYQGNTMSSLILYLLKRYFESNAFEDGDQSVLLGFAPGFEIELLSTCFRN